MGGETDPAAAGGQRDQGRGLRDQRGRPDRGQGEAEDLREDEARQRPGPAEDRESELRRHGEDLPLPADLQQRRRPPVAELPTGLQLVLQEEGQQAESASDVLRAEAQHERQ